MKALSLFSGIGGIDLACEWAGIETVAFCEREPFPQKVLRKHWPNIPIYDDVCTLTKERLDADGIGTIDIISSGDPCQPYSLAGEREGEKDDRFLWPEVNRLLETIRPRWVVRENVAGNITLGLDGVLADLERIGYTWQTFVLPAVAVNAPHRRDRVFVVAHTAGQRLPEGYKHHELMFADPKGYTGTWNGRRLAKPGIQRVVDGVPAQLDRLKAIGNSVVPAQIYPILAAIKQIDDMIKEDTI